MAHLRKLIRDNITTTLTGLVTTSSRVYQTQLYPLTANNLPGLAIYTKNQSSEYMTMGLPRTLRNELSLVVEMYVKGTTGYDNTLDTISEEVEAALYADTTRGGYALDTQIESFDASFGADGEQPVAVGTLNLKVTYISIEGSQSQ